MRWSQFSVLSSLQALLTGGPASGNGRRESQVERIRAAMLDCLDEGVGEMKDALTHRLRFAADVESLWYLRGDLVLALAATRGEGFARQAVAALTPLFEGLMPRALLQTARPRP